MHGKVANAVMAQKGTPMCVAGRQARTALCINQREKAAYVRTYKNCITGNKKERQVEVVALGAACAADDALTKN